MKSIKEMTLNVDTLVCYGSILAAVVIIVAFSASVAHAIKKCKSKADQKISLKAGPAAVIEDAPVNTRSAIITFSFPGTCLLTAYKSTNGGDIHYALYGHLPVLSGSSTQTVECMREIVLDFKGTDDMLCFLDEKQIPIAALTSYMFSTNHAFPLHTATEKR